MLKRICLSLTFIAAALLGAARLCGALSWSDFAVSLASNLVAAVFIVGGVDVLRRRAEEHSNRHFVHKALGRPIAFIGSFTCQLVQLFDDDHDRSHCLARCQGYLDEAAAEIESGSGFLSRGVAGETRVALHALVQDARRLAHSARAILKDDGTQLEIMTPQMFRIIQSARMLASGAPDEAERLAKLIKAEATLRLHGYDEPPTQ